MKTSRKSKIQIGLLLLPGLLVFGIFTIYPILKLFIMSFFEWDFGSMLSHRFIGLENYKEVLGDEYFRTVFINSLVYTLVTVPGQMLAGFLVALLLNQITRFKVGYRVLYYLPVITSWVVASLIFKYVFNTEGLLNYFLMNIVHIASANVRWLDTRWGGMTVAMLLGIWKGIGWNMVVFLAALQTVPTDLYEAAAIDGATAWDKMSIKMITGGEPGHQTDVILTWMYHKAFSTGKFGYAAALSFITTVVLAILAVIQFKLMQQKDQ